MTSSTEKPDTLSELISGILEDVDLEVKLLRVLTSCRTKAQVESAIRYFELAGRKDPKMALRVDYYLRSLDPDTRAFGKDVPQHISQRVPLSEGGFYIPGTGYDHGLRP